MYHHVCGTAKPVPTDVYTYINVEGARQNQKVKELARRTRNQPQASHRKIKTATGDLLKLGNVELLKRKETKTDRRVKTGLEKVVKRELVAKSLIPDPKAQRDKNTMAERKAKVRRRAELKDYIRLFPEFAYEGSSAYPSSRSSSNKI